MRGIFSKYRIWYLLVFSMLWLLWQIFTDELAGLIREHISGGGVIMWSITHPNYIMPVLLIIVCLYFLTHKKKEERITFVRAEKSPIPSRRDHDGVCWEDGGLDSLGHVIVKGPLCPKDWTPLIWRRRWQNRHEPDKVETNVKDGFTVFVGRSVAFQLICLDCGGEYSLGVRPKQLGKSRAEAGLLFEGMRRRGQ